MRSPGRKTAAVPRTGLRLARAIPACALLALAACAEKTEVATPPAPTGDLEVRVSGLRSANGLLLVSLFDAAEGFPDAADRALQTRTAVLNKGLDPFRFSGLPHGAYAVAVLHDENGNGKMDVNFLGIPKEGAGASNNPEPRMGPPSYEECRFALNSDRLALDIDLVYPP